MLLGEHAVLHGRRAVVMAVNRRITVTVLVRKDDRVIIRSALGSHETTLRQLAPHPSFRFLLAALFKHVDQMPGGVEIAVDSQFSHTIGFGSSAAVTVAALAAFRQCASLEHSPYAIRDDAIDIIRAIQGRASGADAAASAHGGVLAYRADPREVKPLAVSLRGVAIYSGYKTPTSEVIRRVEEMWRDRPRELNDLYDRMQSCAEDGIRALEASNFAAFGKALNRGHALMDELGVNTPELQRIVDHLQNDPGIFGAKISGSGLGDCAIGIGTLSQPWRGEDAYEIASDSQGVLLL